MHRSNALQSVLMVKRQKEEAEERRLVALGLEMLPAAAEVEQCDRRVEELRAERLRDVRRLLDGAHYQCEEARYRQWQQQRADVVARLERLRAMRAEQMETYLRVRREREVIGELADRRKEERLREQRAREQKSQEDLFLARRVRD